MKLYLMYGFVIVISILFFIIMKDKIKALKLTGIITIIASLILVIISFIAKFIIEISITNINLSWLTNYLLIKFVTTSLIMLVVGIIELLLSKLLSSKKKIKV